MDINVKADWIDAAKTGLRVHANGVTLGFSRLQAEMFFGTSKLSKRSRFRDMMTSKHPEVVAMTMLVRKMLAEPFPDEPSIDSGAEVDR